MLCFHWTPECYGNYIVRQWHYFPFGNHVSKVLYEGSGNQLLTSMSATGPDQTVRRPMLSPPDQYSLLSGDATRLEDSLHTVLSHTLLFKESFSAESRRRGALMIGSWFYVHRISLSAKVGIKTVKKTCSLIFFSAFKICFCTLNILLPSSYLY